MPTYMVPRGIHVWPGRHAPHLQRQARPARRRANVRIANLANAALIRPQQQKQYRWLTGDNHRLIIRRHLAFLPTRNLACGFWRSADRFADRPALDFGQCVVSYAQLRELACSLAATLDKHQPPEGPRLVAILAGRSTTAFGGVLATLLSGGGYAPLDPASPAARNRAMLEVAGCPILLLHPDCVNWPTRCSRTYIGH